MSHICSECGKPAKFRCNRCFNTFYCNSDCQKSAWSKHKTECISIARIWKSLGNSKNLAITYFGYNVFCQVAFKISRDMSHNVLSIGSGRGFMEGFIKYLTGLSIICIDPNPTSWQPKPLTTHDIIENMCTPPSYKTVEHMLSCQMDHDLFEKPNKLIINWPSPNQAENFDSSAIRILRPEEIILVVELFGGAGSSQLIDWLSTIDGIYNPLEKEILQALRSVESDREPDHEPDHEPITTKYYLTELIKGYNGKELKLPANFANMTQIQKSTVAVAITNLSFVYAIIILSKVPQKSTIKVDPSEFKRVNVGNPIMNQCFENLLKQVMR